MQFLTIFVQIRVKTEQKRHKNTPKIETKSKKAEFPPWERYSTVGTLQIIINPTVEIYTNNGIFGLYLVENEKC